MPSMQTGMALGLVLSITGVAILYPGANGLTGLQLYHAGRYTYSFFLGGAAGYIY